MTNTQLESRQSESRQPEGRQFSFERLVVWQLAVEAMVQADQVARGVGRPYGELADQLRRASLSVVANLAEGVGKDGKDQKRFFSIARGSACESAALIEAAVRLGLVSPEAHGQLRTLLLRVVGALTVLTRPS